MKITVAGVGYVGLSLAVLLAQHHEVTAITTTEAKAEKLNKFISPIQDDEIERFFEEAKAGKRTLNLTTTTDKAAAYASAELVIIATPTNYDSQKNYFDTSAVEDAIEETMKANPNVYMVIKSTIPVGYTQSVRKKYKTDKILFSPEFLRESKALYDNLYPRIQIVVKRLRLPQKLRTEKNLVRLILLPHRLCIPNRDRALDDHVDIRICLHGFFNSILYCAGIEIVFLTIIVGRSCDDDQFCRSICGGFIRGCCQVQCPLTRFCFFKEPLNFIVLNWADEFIQFLCFRFCGCDGGNLVVLCQ